MIYQNTFLNQSIIFIHTLGPGPGSNFMDLSKNIFVSGHKTQKSQMFSATIFLSPSSHFEEPHQSHHRDGCQATHINSFLISAFCALCF